MLGHQFPGINTSTNFSPWGRIVTLGVWESMVVQASPHSHIHTLSYFPPRSSLRRIVLLLGSLGASLLISKAVVLAAPALLYPLWNPWIRAGVGQGRCGGAV